MIVFAVPQSSRNIHKALPRKERRHRLVTQPVLGKFIVVQINRNLVFLFAKTRNAADTFKRS